MSSRIPRLTATAATALALAAIAAAPAQAAKKGHTRHCDAVVLRVTPFGQQTTVIQAATKITTRGVSCKRARSLIGSSILQVGSASPMPPVCCGTDWPANDADWWRKKGWRVIRGIGANTKAKDGARLVVEHRRRTVRFTRWA